MAFKERLKQSVPIYPLLLVVRDGDQNGEGLKESKTTSVVLSPTVDKINIAIDIVLKIRQTTGGSTSSA